MSLEFIRTRSYINDHSTDQLEIIGLSDLSGLKNKDILIIEDMIDTGVTMIQLKKELEKFQPKSIHVVSLFTKRRKDKNCVYKPDYSGFEIPDHFIVGYALVRRKYSSYIFSKFCFFFSLIGL
jgi:hypoxanthine phosphoribosyltransferase